MVPLGLTHIHDAGIGDVLLCLFQLKIQITGAQIHVIYCIIKIGLNLFDVTRCNVLHHKSRTILICSNFRPNGILSKLSNFSFGCALWALWVVFVPEHYKIRLSSNLRARPTSLWPISLLVAWFAGPASFFCKIRVDYVEQHHCTCLIGSSHKRGATAEVTEISHHVVVIICHCVLGVSCSNAETVQIWESPFRT